MYKGSSNPYSTSKEDSVVHKNFPGYFDKFYDMLLFSAHTSA